jgi:hypothetical protein
VKAAWALALLALAAGCGHGGRAPNPPTPRRARELHRPALARPPVQPPPRPHRHLGGGASGEQLHWPHELAARPRPR